MFSASHTYTHEQKPELITTSGPWASELSGPHWEHTRTNRYSVVQGTDEPCLLANTLLSNFPFASPVKAGSILTGRGLNE
jgi:hypothetical protein